MIFLKDVGQKMSWLPCIYPLRHLIVLFFLKFNPGVQYMTEQEIRDIFSIVEDSER